MPYIEAIEINRTSFKTIELINLIHWLVVWKCLEHISGNSYISSSQLTNSIIFQRGVYIYRYRYRYKYIYIGIPWYTTNQIINHNISKIHGIP